MRAEGLEPPRLSSREPKSRASTSSATPARRHFPNQEPPHHRECTRPRYAAGRGSGQARPLYHRVFAVQRENAASPPAAGPASAPTDLGKDRRQRLGQVLGDQPAADRLAGLAMQPDGGRAPPRRPACPAPAGRRPCRRARRRCRRWRAPAARCRRSRRGRPGAATTVSGPLRRRPRRTRAAAARARSSLRCDLGEVGEQARELALVRRQHDRRPAAPDGARRAAPASSANEVSPSASSTSRRLRGERRLDQRRASPRRRRAPARAPRRCAARRRGSRSSPAAPSIGSSMIAVRCAALTASASGGEATVTSPAPTRSAPRAASRAAPVRVAGPETTTAWPRSYLCPSRGQRRQRPEARPVPKAVAAGSSSSTLGVDADVGDQRPAGMSRGPAGAGGRASGGRR